MLSHYWCDRLTRSACVFCVIILAFTDHREAAAETIVFLRHGEKPAKGLGQLSCQGLNRALKVPGVINRMFGVPTAVFAPNPSVQKDDGGKPFDYVRPLSTIEPTAVRYGLPVNVDIGFNDIGALVAALSAPEYVDGTIIVAWEHNQIVDAATQLLAAHKGDEKAVPKWKSSDFDSLYIVAIDRTGKATFERREEQLNNQPTACPN